MPMHQTDTLFHKVSPVLMALWWLLFAPRAKLRWSAPILWAIYPLGYLIYVLARGRTVDDVGYILGLIADIRHDYAHYLMAMGRMAESAAESKQAVDLDPHVLRLLGHQRLGRHG